MSTIDATVIRRAIDAFCRFAADLGRYDPPGRPNNLVVVANEQVAALRAALSQSGQDTERLDYLNYITEAYGFENEHHGNRWLIEGPFNNVREAIDAAIQIMEQTR